MDRAQEEHDTFAQVLRDHDVEVLLLGDLLRQTIELSGAARMQGIAAAVNARRLGQHLAQELAGHLRTLPPADLATILMAGMTFDEMPESPAAARASLVRRMHHGVEFAIDPLPNLLFTRDELVLDRDPVRDHHPRAARAGARDLDDRPDLRPPPAVPGCPSRVRVAQRPDRGRRHAADGAGGASRSVSVSGPRPRGRRRWRAACSTTGSRTRVLAVPIEQRASGRCISTRSAPWSTPTPW